MVPEKRSCRQEGIENKENSKYVCKAKQPSVLLDDNGSYWDIK